MSVFGLFGSRAKLEAKIAAVFADPPSLETDRLILTKIVPAFAADMYRYASDPEVTKYLTWQPHSSERETARYIDLLQKKYADGSFNDFGVTLKDTGRMIGTCGFTSFDFPHNTAELGYVLARDTWGNGYAPEAVRAVMRFGYETFGLDGYTAKCMEGNEASEKVMQKCGMTLEGFYRHSLYVKGSFRNIIVYHIKKADGETQA